MINTENSLSKSRGMSVHRLTGKPLRKWWQDPSLEFKAPREHWQALTTAKKNDAHTNQAIKLLLTTLLTFPFMIMIGYPSNEKFASPNTIVPIIAAWIGLFILLVLCFRRHRYHVLEVQPSETGLEFRSPFLKHKVRWSEITDFFPAGTIEPNEFVLQCKNGQEFFLSKDLTESAKLFKLIIEKLPHSKPSYELNYRLPDCFIDLDRTLAFTMLGVGLLALYQGWRSPRFLAVHSLSDLTALIVVVLIITLPLFWSWLNLYKTPQLIRAGKSGLKIRTGANNKVIPWNQITQIKQLPGLLIVCSHLGWFVMFASKNEPLTEELLDYKRKFLTLNTISS